MEVSTTAQTPLSGERKALDAALTGARTSLEQRDHRLRPPPKVPQQSIFKQRDHRRLPPLRIPVQINRFPLRLLYPEKKNPVSPLSTTPPQTTYRYSSGEAYESAQAPASQPGKSKKSRSTIFDANFLQVIGSAVPSNVDLPWSGDQSSSSSDSSASTIREALPAYYAEPIPGNTEFLQIHRLTLNWTTVTMLSTLKEKQWGDPITPAKCGIKSTFRDKFSINANAPNLGQKALDDGFDVAIFMLSARIYGHNRKDLSGFIPYKLRASQKLTLEYSSANAVSVRRKVAWIKLCAALDPRSANERLSREFEEVSADFFSGRPVEAEYGDGFATFSDAPKSYNLSFKKGDRTKVLEEQPLANSSVAIFLEDVIMANEMEEARIKNGTYQNGMRVYRHQSHMEVYIKLQNARREQEKYIYHDLTKGINPEMTPEFKKIVVDASTDLPDQETAVLEFDGAYASISEYRRPQIIDTSEVGATVNNISPEHISTADSTSTVIDTTSTSSPIALTPTKISKEPNTTTRPSRLNLSTTGASADGSASSIIPTSSEAQSYIGTLQAASQDDKAMLSGVKSTKSIPEIEPSSIKKSKKGARRKRSKKGESVEMTKELSCGQVSRDLDGGHVEIEQPPETCPGLSIQVEPEAPPRFQHGSQYPTTSDKDGEWNEIKAKSSQKLRDSKKEASPAPAKTNHKTPSTVRIDANRVREFKSEEYPALPSDFLARTPAGNKINRVSVPSVSAGNTAIPKVSWEETVQNLLSDELYAVRTLTQDSQTPVPPPGAQLDSVNAATVRTSHTQPPSDEAITNMGKILNENYGETPDLRSTGLERAAADLASPTKFRSSWRHSSLPYRSSTPSQDGFDLQAEIFTSRHHSNITAILDPRVRVVQFGDFPVELQVSAAKSSVADSGHSVSRSHSIAEAAPVYHVQASEPDNRSMLRSNFPRNPRFSSAPVTTRMPMCPPPNQLPMFGLPSYLPGGFLPSGSGHRAGFPNPHVTSYSPSIPHSFSYEPPPMFFNSFDQVSNRARPVPDAYERLPSTNTGSGVSSHSNQQIDQDMQQDGERDENVSGTSRSSESFEGSSNNNPRPGQPGQPEQPEQPGQTANPQVPTAIAGYTCSCCHKGYVACLQRPLYFCGGCGPTGAIRYCSAACLLADAYHHTHHCSQYAHYMRVDPHIMPPDIYEYERFYLAPCELRTEKETAERFRQRQFAMYCYHGPFPRILRAWAEKHELPVGLTGCDINESSKKTGDYHIFRSEVSADGKKFAPCEVICTLRLRQGDPMKEALNRALNACLIFLQPRVVKFLFRLIRHLILDLDNWSLMMPVLDQHTVFAEFIHQFSREFSFDAKAPTNDFTRFDLTKEWRLIRLDIEDLEMQFQVLRCWYRAKTQHITPPVEPRD